ncbi:MAG: ribosome maturation factor RimP [Coriobacteriia bacterium]|nr:ribosome maturation factor RimP [Actinomycetota bacterium]MDZ4166826.1 ribosome maturation factor RimP [Coriobacteriia bacterium]
MSTALTDELTAHLEPLAAGHGLDLVAVEIVGGHRSMVVRVYLDREGGIDIETVARANSWVAEALDGMRSLSGPYTLEVSSPGLDRILRTRRDFERFNGQCAVLHTSRPLGGRSRFTGELAGLENDDVVIVIDGQELRVPLDAIERARLKPEFDESVLRGTGDLI